MQQALNIAQVVSFLLAFIALASRLFVASRPFWSRLPAFYQTFLPALVPALATFAQGLTGVKSWGDLSVQFMVCAAMLLPGLPSNRSSAPLQASKEPTLTPSAGDLKVAAVVTDKAVSAMLAERPSVPPPSSPNFPTAAALLLLCCFGVKATACAVFGSGGSFWPIVDHCAPSPASLVSQVTDILLAGGDYEQALKDRALIDGVQAVECAVAAATQALSSKMGASPGETSAEARGKAFMAKHKVLQ